MECSVPVCDRPAKVRGLCRGHYQRFMRTGDWPTTPLERKQPGLLCDVPGCGRKHEAKGLCHSHYAELKRSGVRPTEPIVLRSDKTARFWAKVLPPDANGCRIWAGGTDGDGRYGGFWDGRRVVRAHRWAYEQHHGPLPDGVVLDHLCRVTRCVNPDHLEPVTQQVNVLRGGAPSAINASKTECIHGHELSGDNLILRPGGGRDCRLCARERAREATRRYRARKRSV